MRRGLSLALLVFLPFVGTGFSGREQATKRRSRPDPEVKSAERGKRLVRPEGAEKLIWAGSRTGVSLRWTTADLYSRSAGGKEKRHLSPLAQKEVEEFIASLDPGDRGCEYGFSFRLLSVVGDLVSFAAHSGLFCGGAHPTLGVEFGVVNLAAGATGARLTDLFPESEILVAMLADPVVKKALAEQPNSAPVRTLADLVERFASERYELGSTGYELGHDFVSGFAFHHIEGDKIAVRIGLPPLYGANHATQLQLGILLPIPDGLRQSLLLADQQREGFLMKDERRLSRGRTTELKYLPQK